jgi:hypothetical protein
VQQHQILQIFEQKQYEHQHQVLQIFEQKQHEHQHQVLQILEKKQHEHQQKQIKHGDIQLQAELVHINVKHDINERGVQH